MKPPQRRRAAPARYLGEVPGPAAWSAREKRQLLRLLQARQGQPEPDAAELARELPGRSEAEVRGPGQGAGLETRRGYGRGILAAEGRGELRRDAGCGRGIREAEGRDDEAGLRGGASLGERLDVGGAYVRLKGEARWRPRVREAEGSDSELDGAEARVRAERAAGPRGSEAEVKARKRGRVGEAGR